MKSIVCFLVAGVLLISCTSSSTKDTNDKNPNIEFVLVDDMWYGDADCFGQEKIKTPNIVFILVDDMGYGDAGCFGQEKIKTPNIDKLAQEGLRFTEAYAGNAVCAPSRSCLMQGLHPGHARVRGNSYNGFRESLRKEDTTVAMMLKEEGYKTGLFGKWGLGLNNQYGIPNNMGFDEFYGYLNQRQAHCQYPEFLYHNTEKVFLPENGTHYLKENYRGKQVYDENGICHPLGIKDASKAKYAFDVYCEKSLEFVKNNKSNPFFLYLAYTPPHGSHVVPELGEYAKEDWRLEHKVYAAMNTRVDKEVGKLINLLKELNIDDNTLVVFASDNGNAFSKPLEGTVPGNIFFNNDSPREGQKGSRLDGAFHVPAIAWWPNHIKAGEVSSHIWAFWDFMPTVAEVIDVDSPAGHDGISFLPTLLGQKDKQKKHDFLYWEYQGEQSVRMGDWYGYKNINGELKIFNLIENPKQDKDLAAEYPDITKKISDIIKNEHSPSDVWPSPGETKEEFKKRIKGLGVSKKDRRGNLSHY